MKLTCKRLKYLIKDEKKAAHEYSKLGLRNIAKDERKHHRILKRKLEEVCKWKESQIKQNKQSVK